MRCTVVRLRRGHPDVYAVGCVLLVLAALAVLWRYRAVAAKQFGGITGDLAGWFLQRAELVMLAALLISEGWIG